MSVDDRYTYPGSGGVLVNKFGIRDAAQLDRAMNDVASVHWADMRTEPPPERFDVAYLGEVHRCLFFDLLPFAGQWRTVNVQAGGTGIAYCRPEYLAAAAAQIDAALKADGYLRGLTAAAFADRLAYHWGELTALHPMRDGNTRSQSVFVTQLAEAAGHQLDWRQLQVDTLRVLRLQAMSVDHRPLAAYLERALTPARLSLADEIQRRTAILDFRAQAGRDIRGSGPSRGLRR